MSTLINTVTGPVAPSQLGSTLMHVPAMVNPFIADQRFWGARVARLGAGLGPVARSGLSPDSLATALRELAENPAYRERTASFAAALASEDGPARAVAALPF